MKTTTKKSAFGFSAVNAGQRNVSVEPQLIVTSTQGAFRLTGPVTKALGIAHGDKVMFINNVADIDAALAAQDPKIVAFAEENGLALGSVELAIAVHKEFDLWGVAKGYALYNSKGVPVTVKERLSLKERETMVSSNFEAALEAALSSGDEELVAALSREGVTKDEQIEILAGAMTGGEVHKHSGSRTATPSSCTGVGLNLNFTDSNVWNQLKVDMENPTELNRVFDIDLDAIQTISLNDGSKDIQVAVAILGDYTDKAPVARGAKESDEE